MVACTRDEEWYLYISVGLVSYLGGLVILIPCRFLWYCFHKPDRFGDPQFNAPRKNSLNIFRRIRAGAVGLLSGHNNASKVLVATLFLLNLASIVIYLIEATEYTLDDCGSVTDDPLPLVYIGLCGVFIIHFIIRFVGSSDKLWFWLEVYSIVDHFTIGPTLFGLFMGRNWLGLRFLRILYLLRLPEVLQMLHILRAASTIRLAQIGTIFLSIWMTSTGFAHLIENNGDPHKDWANASPLGYWEGMYWLLVTMSTVGYGEITPSTDIGRAFIVIFIIGSIAMFTAIVPELVTYIATRKTYNKPYKRIYGKRHIVVCGHINYHSVSEFVKNFIHEDADNTDINVIFVDKNKPDLELEAFLKRNLNNVVYIQGSIMDLQALRDSKVRDARACLILANRMCPDPDEDDAANIMRATSVKNFYPGIRVIIQLHQFHNKTYLLHIPNWNWDKVSGDDCICLAELKLGLMAQNCLAPGVATLMANLFTNRSYKPGVRGTWQDLYNYGASNEIYCASFSEEFIGMSFSQAAQICYTELNLLLLATESGLRTAKEKLRLNPQSASIGFGTTGFFIAQSPEEVRRVTTYNGQKKESYIAVKNDSFSEDPPEGFKRRKLNVRDDINDNQEPENDYLEFLEGVGSRLASHWRLNDFLFYRPRQNPEVTESQTGDGDTTVQTKLTNQNQREDSPSSDTEDPEKSPKTGQRRPSMAVEMMLKNKNVTGPSGKEEEMFDFTGMFHWCPGKNMQQCTLDHQSIRDKRFRNHVILCLLSDGESPLTGLVNFVMPLRTSNVHYKDLKDIVILCDTDYLTKEWTSICTFPKIYVFHGRPSNRQDLRTLNVEISRMCVILSAKKHIMVDKTLLDKEAILAALNLKGMFSDSVEAQIKAIGTLTNANEFRQQIGGMNGIPMTTELEIDSNVAFLDQDDDDDPDIPLYMTQPFACGSAFAASCLDSLMSATFHDRQILMAVRALITGGETGEFEQILAEGLGIVRKQDKRQTVVEKERSHLTVLHVNEEPLVNVKSSMLYGSLFVGALRSQGILCLGLYRVMDDKGQKRFVITNPGRDFPLLPSDKVFCLRPGNNTEELQGIEEGSEEEESGLTSQQLGIQDEPEADRPQRRIPKHGSHRQSYNDTKM